MTNEEKSRAADVAFEGNRLHSDALEKHGVTSHRAAPHDADDV